MKEEKTYYSIKQINEFIKEIFDSIPLFNNITLRGEISNFKGANKSGHLYFTLKDSESTIDAVIFKGNTYGLRFTPKTGDDVIVTGQISSYPPSGKYQIIIRSMSLFGEGELLLKKKMLAEKLLNEGLFDEGHKLPLPTYPLSICIITGKNSAAARDFEYNINRRFPIANITTLYSLVQGKDAHLDIIKNLKEAESLKPDLIIIGRGGGLSEDLSAFDEEELVRAIYELKIPVISAVGHEINKSLCDLVADGYASTPTGAAELAVPDYHEIIEWLSQNLYHIQSLLNGKIKVIEQKLDGLKNNKYLSNVENIYKNYETKLNHLLSSINTHTSNKLKSSEERLKALNEKLEVLNPTSILDRGYSIVFDENGNIIKDVKNLKIDESINIKLGSGSIRAKVEEIKDEWFWKDDESIRRNYKHYWRRKCFLRRKYRSLSRSQKAYWWIIKEITRF